MTLLLSVLAATGAQGSSPNLKLGEPLANALSAYRPLGLNIVSTTGLITSHHRVTVFPQPDLDAVDQVRQLLNPHDLVLKHLQDNTWYVAKADRTTEVERPLKATEHFKPVIEEVVVTASYHLARLNRLQQNLNRRDLQTIPSAGGDTLRTVATLPGAATSGVAASHRFRGGDQNEVLYLFDNVPVLDPFHLRNFHNVFTAVNPNIVAGAEIFTAGFPVEFGGKISGVVSLELLEPQSRFEGEVDLNTVAMGAHAAGISANTTWLVSARRSTIDFLLPKLDADYGRPRFHDELLRVDWADMNRTFSVGAINTDDEIRLNDVDAGEQGSANFGYRSVWGNGSISLGTNWFSEVQLIWQRAEGRHSGTLDNPTDAVGQLRAGTSYEVMRVTNKWVWSPPANHEFTIGWTAEKQTGDFEYALNTTYGPLALGLQPGNQLDRALAIDRDGIAFSAYLSITSELTDSITLRYGLRYDVQDIDPVHDTQLSPRLQIAFAPNDRWQMLLDAGRYVQHQNLFEIQIDDGLVELQPPQSAEQLSLSVARTWKNGVRLRADTYLRHIDDPWRRFDNVYNRWVLLPELHADRYEVMPSRADMKGLELTLSKPRSAGWSWHLSYALTDTREKVAGHWHAKPWDQQHAFKAGLRYAAARWDVGAQLTHRTGWPTTRRLPAGADVTVLLNESQLPSFISFDLHLTRRLTVGHLEGEIYLDVTNVFDRVNVGGYEHQLSNTGWARDEQKLLPVFPTLGFKVSW